MTTITTATGSTIDLTAAPAGYDQTHTLFNVQIGTANADAGDSFGTGIEGDIILAHDIDSQKSSLAYHDGTMWADSISTQDWPILDRVFGRENWQSIVAEHQDESLAELEDEE